MKLLASHELIGEGKLVQRFSSEHSCSLQSTVGMHSMSRVLQACESLSPQEVRGIINNDQGQICLWANLDFLVINKDEITEGRCPKSCDSGPQWRWHGGAANTTGPEYSVVLVMISPGSPSMLVLRRN